ncbi:hypothetical protein FRC12_022045 [Ceratobasidium sp. 428]|nr:hypothetical protein FRC12_022045 [Ceratobasidium sp. 428]
MGKLSRTDMTERQLYDVWSMDECMQDHITSQSTVSTGLTSLLSGIDPEKSRVIVQIFHFETQGVKDIGVTVRGHTEFDKFEEWLAGLQSSSYVQAVKASKLRHKLLMYTLLVMEVIKVIYKITMINWTRVRDWGNKIDKTIVFQEQYINPRIQAHADRVAAHGLAEPLSVWVGIREAMTVVWRSLPPGFGSIEKDDAQASDSGNQQSRTDER